MGRLLNKIVRKVMAAYSGLAQDLNGRTLGGDCAVERFPSVIREAAAESCVLLKNNDGVLPLKKEDKVAVFGRTQRDYFYVGYGSGGDVCYPYSISLIDGMKNGGINIDEELLAVYDNWRAKSKNSADEGFWGHWTYAFPEMPLNEETVKAAAKRSGKAVIVLGRAAGEDRENKLKKGSYYLSDKEAAMVEKVALYFDKIIVVLDCGNVIDMSWTEKYGDKISAVLLAWLGGMESGNSVADVLSGKICPSGKLTDTIARNYEDYPSSANFGDRKENRYVEDIFVGYRYFETFAKDKVLYPFGFGLSYTQFEIAPSEFIADGDKITVKVTVKNTGAVAGKETVQVYCRAPQGKLGKALRVLVGFAKTDILEPKASEEVTVTFDKKAFASYDDSGKTGHKSAFVLEAGEYVFYVGADCRATAKAGILPVDELCVLEQLKEVNAVRKDKVFDRMVAKAAEGKMTVSYEAVPTRTVDLRKKIVDNLPEGVEMTGDKGYKLSDVKDGKVTMDEFVAQLNLDELEAISRGDGLMNCKLGTAGNAGALAGVTQFLRDKGVPALITTDGPAGIRLKRTCALLPCGTGLASTWNRELTEKVYACLAEEMKIQGSDIILAPGMNIHRNPLCGRNFEYFSEDPLLSGEMAAAVVNGVQKNGGSACPKHFACNNQETNRNHNDSIVSERALREIYFKGFEIVVKTAKPDCIMTSYNKINGVWSHYNYELCEDILRKEWGYEGLVMTDWWMRYAFSPEFPEMESNAYRVRARVDVLMPGGKNALSKSASNDGTLLKTYGKTDGITLGEMQLVAKDVLNYAMKKL